MEKHVYKVTFKNGDICMVKTYTENQAKILAQADAIVAGKDYTVVSVEFSDKEKEKDAEKFKQHLLIEMEVGDEKKMYSIPDYICKYLVKDGEFKVDDYDFDFPFTVVKRLK